MLEYEVWLSKWIETGGNLEEIQYIIDKFDEGASEIIIQEKEGQNVFPTLTE